MGLKRRKARFFAPKRAKVITSGSDNTVCQQDRSKRLSALAVIRLEKLNISSGKKIDSQPVSCVYIRTWIRVLPDKFLSFMK